MNRITASLFASACALALTACATFDQGADERYGGGGGIPGTYAPHDGWVVTVTPEELAALGAGRMELDTRAADVVYVVGYGRVDQLDAVFARTLGGLMPLRMLIPELRDAGKIVLRNREGGLPESEVQALGCEPG